MLLCIISMYSRSAIPDPKSELRNSKRRIQDCRFFKNSVGSCYIGSISLNIVILCKCRVYNSQWFWKQMSPFYIILSSYIVTNDSVVCPLVWNIPNSSLSSTIINSILTKRYYFLIALTKTGFHLWITYINETLGTVFWYQTILTMFLYF